MFIFLNRATKPPPPVSSKSQSLASHRLRLLNELSRELFVAHACRATVAILDADDQLPVGSVSATFVLSYLQAFPEALRRSADEPEEDANPVVMLGRKLHGLVAREEERAAKERNLAESAVETMRFGFRRTLPEEPLLRYHGQKIGLKYACEMGS